MRTVVSRLSCSIRRQAFFPEHFTAWKSASLTMLRWSHGKLNGNGGDFRLLLSPQLLFSWSGINDWSISAVNQDNIPVNCDLELLKKDPYSFSYKNFISSITSKKCVFKQKFCLKCQHRDDKKITHVGFFCSSSFSFSSTLL